mgnify:CR=1 FL=1
MGSKTSTGSWNNGYGLGQLGNDTTFGFWIIERAIAMRWRWPPENSCG